MIRAVIQNSFYADHGVCRQRAFQDGILQSFFHCREEVLRYRSAHNFLREFKRFFQIAQRGESHLNMAVLSMSAGLLLIFIFHIGIFLDRLAECHFRLRQLNLYFIFIGKSAGNHFQMQVAHTVNQCLPVLRIVYHFHRRVFMRHLL